MPDWDDSVHSPAGRLVMTPPRRPEGETVSDDINWLRRFINCSAFGPPPSEIGRAQGVVSAIESALATAQEQMRKDAGTIHWLEHRAEQAEASLATARAGALKWIPVGERLPEDGVDVLAYHAKRGRIAVGSVFRRGDGLSWTFAGTSAHESHFPDIAFTHWQPLPTAPLAASPSGEGT